MANALQLRRGTTTEHGSFTGLAGEITVDTTKDTIIVHDGATAGGIPLAKESSISTDAATLGGQSLSQIQTAYEGYADTAAAAVVDSAPGTLDTLNELAAALGDDANFSTTVTNSIATKMPLAGGTFTGGITVDGALGINEVYEQITLDTNTGSNDFGVDVSARSLVYLTAFQTSNRGVDFTNANTSLSVGQSYTATVLFTVPATSHYFNSYKVDGVAVTPKWQGGTAPSDGLSAYQGIDAYTFTLIKTANATFTVLASHTNFE